MCLYACNHMCIRTANAYESLVTWQQLTPLQAMLAYTYKYGYRACGRDWQCLYDRSWTTVGGIIAKFSLSHADLIANWWTMYTRICNLVATLAKGHVVSIVYTYMYICMCGHNSKQLPFLLSLLKCTYTLSCVLHGVVPLMWPLLTPPASNDVDV